MTTTELNDVKKAMAEHLRSGRVRTFIGWEQGSNSFRSRPGFFRNAEEVDQAIFSPACSQCLVRMIIEDIHYPLDGPDKRDPLGIILRGCDDKGVIELIKDNKIRREDLVIICVDCPGVVDWKKVRELVRKKRVTKEDLNRGRLVWKNRDVVLEEGGKEKNFQAAEILMNKCIECEGHTPRIYDVLVGKEDTDRKIAPDPEEVIELEQKPSEEKWEYWDDVFSKCIRCYACRNICTYCYCEECAIDPTTLAVTAASTAADKANRPLWVGRDSTTSSNSAYLIMRAYHGSGRCISCQECDRACPVGLPLRVLNRKVRKDVRELFDYEAGDKVDDKPLFGDSSDSDPGEFIW